MAPQHPASPRTFRCHHADPGQSASPGVFLVRKAHRHGVYTTTGLPAGKVSRGSAKSTAGCLMFGVFGVLTGVRRGPAGTIGGV